MDIQLNGKAFQTDPEIRLNLLLESLKLDPQQVVVELNGSVLTIDQFSATTLAHGDIVEIVQFVGGG
ncbi:MAG: thiamine biosynthesis protein ThiS [Desulfuromonas sp.]|jgi:sulfur carrier protein|nr:MAG: thiamine biosynthesis protein ThiS [Desulfuromonas sp.]